MSHNKKMLMSAAGVSTSQTIAVSSNDWDYTFAQNEWPFAGNALGDHTQGGYVDNTGGDSAISGLITLDGAFDITWTATGQRMAIGVHEIAEDSKRAAEHRCGMKAASTASWFYDDQSTTRGMFYGNTSESSDAVADGSVCVLSRDESGTITFTDDGTVIHTFSNTSTNPVRPFIGAPGSPFSTNLDDFQIVDYEKVQRDGTLNYTQSATDTYGDAVTNGKNLGTRFRATRSMQVTDIRLQVVSTSVSFTSKAGIYEDNGGNPGTQIGSDSDGATITGSGAISHPVSATDVLITKGQWYWAVWSDQGTTGNCTVSRHAGRGTDQGTGKNDTITSISDSDSSDQRFEVVGTATGESIPDHDTRLLIHSDTTDGSTTFTDSSQIGATVTANGNVQHDTAQTLGFGTSSILCDGTGDYLSVPSNSLYVLGTGDFTVETIVRINSGTANVAFITNRPNGSQTDVWGLGTNGSSKLVFSSNYSTFIAGGTTLSTATNYHVCAVRSNGLLGIAVDGTWDASEVAHTTDHSSQQAILIGEDGGGLAELNGWLKEPRVSATARWEPGIDFTPPTAAYP